jgi:hypothetical protein
MRRPTQLEIGLELSIASGHMRQDLPRQVGPGVAQNQMARKPQCHTQDPLRTSWTRINCPLLHELLTTDRRQICWMAASDSSGLLPRAKAEARKLRSWWTS